MQWQKFEEILRPYLAEHDWEDLLTRAQELRVPFAAVLDAKTLLENDHLRERGFFAEVEHPELGKVPVAAHPFKMSETPLRVGPSPLLGEHAHEVLARSVTSPRTSSSCASEASHDAVILSDEHARARNNVVSRRDLGWGRRPRVLHHAPPTPAPVVNCHHIPGALHA